VVVVVLRAFERVLADLTKAGSKGILGRGWRSVTLHWSGKVKRFTKELVLIAIEAQDTTAACTPRSTATLKDRHALTRPAKGVRTLGAAIAERC
jgi:hypothetical protein